MLCSELPACCKVPVSSPECCLRLTVLALHSRRIGLPWLDCTLIFVSICLDASVIYLFRLFTSLVLAAREIAITSSLIFGAV